MKRLFFASILLSVALCGAAQSDFNRAVMQVYEDMLRENYKDYEVYFRRANEYYNHGDYLRALDDLNSAVKYAPATDPENLFAIYALRAECFYQLKRYQQALPEANQALKLEPLSTAMLDLRGRINYDFGQYEAAKADFTKLLRVNVRSQEALYGLALVAAKQDNAGLARSYMDEAEKLSPNDAKVYVRRSEVRRAMGDPHGAVNDLLLAIATDINNPDALPTLVNLASSNYSAVISGLTGAIAAAPKQPLFYFLRASIAAAHFHYPEAIKDFNYIIDNNLYNYAGIYSSLAECHYALGHFNEALSNIETALVKHDPALDNPTLYFTIRAKIQRAIAKPDQALLSIDRALEITPDNGDAMLVKALILVDLKKPKEASALLGEATINDPFNPLNYLYRAWVMNDFTNQPTAAKQQYERAADLDLNHSENIGSMLGFAQLFCGQTKKANAWIDGCLTESDDDGKIHYYASCFYAWCGKPDLAFACMEKALKAGYANHYDWTINNDARINVAPLRDDPRFASLLQRYNSIFAL